MLEIITQKNAASAPYGNFLYCEEWVKEKFRLVTENQFVKMLKDDEYTPVSLNIFGNSPWDVLKNQKIFGDFGESLLKAICYTDHYTQPDGTPRTSMAMVPHVWLTKGKGVFGDIYANSSDFHKEMLFDAENNRQVFLDALDEEDPLSIQEVMSLGSGVHADFTPNDGSSSISLIAMDTKQGDVLIFLANCWHNK